MVEGAGHQSHAKGIPDQIVRTSMAGFLARRLLLSLAMLFVASSLSFFFFASRFYPLRGTPLLPAYWRWVKGIPSGRSFTHALTGRPLPFLLHALGHTLALLAVTLLLVVVASVVLGVLGAAFGGSALDLVIRVLSYVGWSVPAFLLALVLQQVVGKVAGGPGLGLLPVAGWPGYCPRGLGIDLHTFQCPRAGSGFAYVGHVIEHLALPAITLAVGFVGLHSRYLRAALVDELGKPYITTARAKGLPERVVMVRHAMRNSVTTFIPALLADFGAIFGASLAVDYVFGLLGLGNVFVLQMHFNSASLDLDTYEMQLLLLLSGGLVVAASVLSELMTAMLDPRASFDS
jgi:peptide/nickel transport system permease protein